MPITPPTPVAGQVGSNGLQPYTNQQNFGQIIGEVSSWAPHADPTMIQNWINNAVRVLYDRRNWYGLFVKGQIVTPGYYSTGTVSLTQGSNIVTGVGTAWTASLGGLPIIGQQLRCGFTSPIYTITGVNLTSQTLTLELPWGLPSVTTGYFISQYYYTFPNIKYIYSVKNLQMMYRLLTNVPQSLIENWDPSRLQMMYPRVVATMPPDPSGNYQVELWPLPNSSQAFPFLAYVQPPNLVKDLDNLPAFMRADIIKARAISDALMFRPKQNPNYSEGMCVQVAQQKLKEFEAEAMRAEQADENLYRQDIVTWAEQTPLVNMDMGSGMFMGGGGFMAAMSPCASGDY